MRGSRVPKKLDAEGLWAYSLKLLGSRAQSAGEVRRKLLRRAGTETDVDSTIARLFEYGYLNDQKFAESYANWRKENEGFGRIRVLRDLRQRHVSSTVAGSAVDQAFHGSEESEQVEAFLARKYRNTNLHEMLKDDRKLASAYRRLRYAGFSSGTAIKVLKRFATEAENLEDEGSEGDE